MKVLHLIPYDGIGGVEVAAKSMQHAKHKRIVFQIRFIYNKPASYTNRCSSLAAEASRIAGEQFDCIIVSLWRAYLVGLLTKLLHPHARLVVFLHLNKDVHLLDFLFTRLAICCATEIWADSEASLHARLPRTCSKKQRVISFVAHRHSPLPRKPVNNHFIFWGRIAPQKHLDGALTLFSKIYQAYPAAFFYIIGPDGGSLVQARKKRDALALGHSVAFVGAMDMENIKRYAENASFYIQTSLYEGMSMSVVESMQLGLVPVVTPVGEIKTYCKHKINSLIIQNENDTVQDIKALLQKDDLYQQIRNNAIQTWAGKPLYQDSMFEACEDLLRREAVDTETGAK